jgi:hypothetical protein
MQALESRAKIKEPRQNTWLLFLGLDLFDTEGLLYN